MRGWVPGGLTHGALALVKEAESLTSGSLVLVPLHLLSVSFPRGRSSLTRTRSQARLHGPTALGRSIR